MKTKMPILGVRGAWRTFSAPYWETDHLVAAGLLGVNGHDAAAYDATGPPTPPLQYDLDSFLFSAHVFDYVSRRRGRASYKSPGDQIVRE